MAITEYVAGSETVDTTEWSMTTDTAGPDADTTDGVYQAFIDLNLLTVTEIYEWKLYEKVQSGLDQRLVAVATFSGVQATPIWISPSFILMHGWDMTLKKLAGTAKQIDWSIRKVA